MWQSGRNQFAQARKQVTKMDGTATICESAQDLSENDEPFTRGRKTESTLFVAKMTSGIRKNILTIKTAVALHCLQGFTLRGLKESTYLSRQ